MTVRPGLTKSLSNHHAWMKNKFFFTHDLGWPLETGGRRTLEAV
jgi:hypothetical protein